MYNPEYKENLLTKTLIPYVRNQPTKLTRKNRSSG